MNVSWVEIESLTLAMEIGVYEWEKNTQQTVELSLSLGCQFDRAAKTDDLQYTVDYAAVCEHIITLSHTKHFNLLEHFAEHVVSLLFTHFPVEVIKLSIRKPGAVAEAKNVGLSIERHREYFEKQKIYLSLGSNIDREANLRVAMAALKHRYANLRASTVYESDAVGFTGDRFFNLIVEVESNESIPELTAFLKELEEQQGRDRSAAKFSSRTLDIDIVMYGNESGDINGIELPRPELYFNAFVLQPMAELVPSLTDPLHGRRFEDLWQNFEHEQKIWPVSCEL